MPGMGRDGGTASSRGPSSSQAIAPVSVSSSASADSATSTARRVSVGGGAGGGGSGSAGARSPSQYGTKSGPCVSPISVPVTSTDSRNHPAPGPPFS
ncbi:hypothetical protein Ssi03_00790 [Sphaerisporangium siamense]|nr:hypothetical protein Ssi03_00790 [Sphaerisporangium siamense]